MNPILAVFTAVELVSLSLAFLCTGYLLLLTVLAARVVIRTEFSARAKRRFAVVVPAHNEEAGIGRTVESILRVEYPRDRFDAIVVADNCTDETASRAAAAGAKVLERHEPGARGKGLALRWGFDRLLGDESTYDSIVVIDADSVISANYLFVLNWYLERGAQAVQTSDLVEPGNDAWNAQMTRIGFLLYNYVRPLGRNAIGGTAGLRGNGMCFASGVLRAIPWSAYSITEDIEYGLQLLTCGIKVTFAPEATVFAIMPRDAKNAEGQRARWEGGRFGLIRRYSLPLLGNAIRSFSLAFLDAFIDLVMPALVNLVGFFILAALLTLFFLWADVRAAGTYSLLWFAAAGLGFIHLLSGLRIAPADPSLYRALLQLPRYALWKVAVYARMPGRWSKNVWTRTTRENRRDMSEAPPSMPEILVIDDDEFMLSTMQGLLLNAGFRVTTTADGPHGIELYSRVRPAAVVLDLGLPSIDGLQVLKQIREIDAGAKVIVVTGYPSEAAALAARTMGAVEFLPKPFDGNQFVGKVNSALSGMS